MRKPGVAAVLALALAAGACASRSGVPTPSPFPGAPLPPVAAEAPSNPETADEAPLVLEEPGSLSAIVRTALGFRGVPYRYGGSDPAGFDCSGFVQYVLARHGTAIPREVRDQYEAGRRVRLNDVQPGDLLFFETESRGASHVGMAIGGHQFVHAPSSRGVVRVERYDLPYWASRLVGVRRVADDAGATPSRSAEFPGAIRTSD